ncbi:hypothetical protein D3C79_608310 [compost metagenome]
MYIDVPRRLVFFDKSDSIRPACLTQYDPDTGALTHPVGTQADDRVCDISHDGRRMALQGTDWRVVRGASRSSMPGSAGSTPCKANSGHPMNVLATVC